VILKNADMDAFLTYTGSVKWKLASLQLLGINDEKKS
jgi:hypothetical protein